MLFTKLFIVDFRHTMTYNSPRVKYVMDSTNPQSTIIADMLFNMLLKFGSCDLIFEGTVAWIFSFIYFNLTNILVSPWSLSSIISQLSLTITQFFPSHYYLGSRMVSTTPHLNHFIISCSYYKFHRNGVLYKQVISSVLSTLFMKQNCKYGGPNSSIETQGLIN